MCEECEQEHALPPVTLAPAAELLADAERSDALRELRQYVTGLDGKREPERTLIADWAQICGLVQVRKRTHVPVKKNAKLLKQPLELWERAFTVIGEVVYNLVVEEHDAPFSFDMLFPEFLETVHTTLYTAGETPVPLELLHGIVREMPAFPGETRDAWSHSLVVLFDLLERLGAIERIRADAEERAKIAELVDVREPDATLVRFTPIAVWATNRQFRERGMDAPVVGELAKESLGKLCAHIAMSSPPVIENELRAWVEHRSSADAAEEATGLLRTTESPSERFFALLALNFTGDTGLASAREVRAEGGISGAVTAAWLVERGAETPESITETEATIGLTDHLAAMNEQGYLLAELLATDEQHGVVSLIAAADHPSRLDLLDVIAQDHPDKKIAKQARKARLALRSGRG